MPDIARTGHPQHTRGVGDGHSAALASRITPSGGSADRFRLRGSTATGLIVIASRVASTAWPPGIPWNQCPPSDTPGGHVMTPTRRRCSGISLDPDELRYATAPAAPPTKATASKSKRRHNRRPHERRHLPSRPRHRHRRQEGDRRSRRAGGRGVRRRGKGQDRHHTPRAPQRSGRRRSPIRARHRRHRRNRKHHRLHRADGAIDPRLVPFVGLTATLVVVWMLALAWSGSRDPTTIGYAPRGSRWTMTRTPGSMPAKPTATNPATSAPPDRVERALRRGGVFAPPAGSSRDSATVVALERPGRSHRLPCGDSRTRWRISDRPESANGNGTRFPVAPPRKWVAVPGFPPPGQPITPARIAIAVN